MGITAMALGLVVLTLVAGCLLWTLPFHLEEIYSPTKDGISHRRRARLLFFTLAGVATAGILVVLVLEFQQLVTS